MAYNTAAISWQYDPNTDSYYSPMNPDTSMTWNTISGTSNTTSNTFWATTSGGGDVGTIQWTTQPQQSKPMVMVDEYGRLKALAAQFEQEAKAKQLPDPDSDIGAALDTLRKFC